jgi:hypothetical protein
MLKLPRSCDLKIIIGIPEPPTSAAKSFERPHLRAGGQTRHIPPRLAEAQSTPLRQPFVPTVGLEPTRGLHLNGF